MLYLECNTGIAGDMLVAALLDLGADQKVLADALASLNLEGYHYHVSRVNKSGVDCCDFNVHLAHDNHDHDMVYLHGEAEAHEHHHYEHEHDHEHEHHHDHHHEHEHEHHHEHHHDHDHEHHHPHEHRGLAEIQEIIGRGNLTANAKKIALKIFDIIAEAEAKAHNKPKLEVHFHEVGAIDSIVDVVAIAVCLDNLNIHEVVVPKLCEGQGSIRCQHGVLPVPVPAVANIAVAHNIDLEIIPCQGEFVTPTGIAAVAAIRTTEKLPKSFSIKKVGLGAGKREYDRPSIVRAMLIEAKEEYNKDIIWKLESDIDDCTGEALGYCMEQLLEAGARDVHYFPIFMKKNRPAYQLNVLCSEDKVEELENIIFTETTTIGIRHFAVERTILQRTTETIETGYGTVVVKACQRAGEIVKYPEYESVAKVAKEKAVSFKELYSLAYAKANCKE